METNKYYTPEISDLYVGFEYELYCRDANPTVKNGSHVWLKSWQTKTFTKSEFERGIGFDRNLDLQDDWIRVKYLDKNDIESLGFELSAEYGDYIEFNDNLKSFKPMSNKILYNTSSKIMLIELFAFEDESTTPLFNGYIKNKSELIKLLKMLNINA